MGERQDDAAPRISAAGISPAAETPPRRRFEDLPAAAQRALREAEARRASYDAAAAERPKETGGPKGREPVRYGDWEIKGIATDF